MTDAAGSDRTDRTAATRMPELMSQDRGELDRLLADTVIGHIGFALEGRPVVIPTAVARWGDILLAHGSTGSRWMRAIGTGIPVSVSLALVDGVVVARSAFESSLVYRSAVLFGAFSPLAASQKEEALAVFTERLLPGRTSEVRASTAKELAATMLLAMPIDSWSLRISDSWPDDPASDIDGPAWAGVVRYGARAAEVHSAPDLRAGIPVPSSVGAISGVR